MTRFRGVVGFSMGQVERKPGVFVEDIVEKVYQGDVKRDTRQSRESEGLNEDLTVSNLIEIVADDFANAHVHVIKFVEWAGVAWSVGDTTVEYPRLTMRLGEVWNGPRSAPPAGDDEASPS